MVNISFLYFTVKSAETVQLQDITVLETAYAHLLLLLGEATHPWHTCSKLSCRFTTKTEARNQRNSTESARRMDQV